MDEARHLVVEKPDGSVAIAFNQEVPPPEPPPEIIQPRSHVRFLLEYHPVARALAYIFVLASGVKFGSLHENNRYYQFCVDSIYDGCSTYRIPGIDSSCSVSWYVCGTHDSTILCTSNVGTSYLPIFNRYDVYHRI
jgi:hypothetical protein